MALIGDIDLKLYRLGRSPTWELPGKIELCRCTRWEMTMKISAILAHKGEFVATISPDATVSELLRLLADHKIGAVLVTVDDAIVGVVSERDVARALVNSGAVILDGPVSRIMSRLVASCELDTPVEEVMVLMTEQRVRHVPVLADGKLVGIVSIGDVVKARIEKLEDERRSLLSYITS